MRVFRASLILIVSFLPLAAGPSFAQSATRTRLLSSPNPSAAGQPVTLTAEVDGLGGGAPNGSVTFKDTAIDGTITVGVETLRVSQNWSRMTQEAGYDHTCALTKTGAVSCWGSNEFGQIGDGTTVRRLTPTSLPDLASSVVALAAAQITVARSPRPGLSSVGA